MPEHGKHTPLLPWSFRAGPDVFIQGSATFHTDSAQHTVSARHRGYVVFRKPRRGRILTQPAWVNRLLIEATPCVSSAVVR